MFDHERHAQLTGRNRSAAPEHPACMDPGPVVEYYPDHCCVLLSDGSIVTLTYPQLDALQTRAEAVAADVMLPFWVVFEELAAAEARA